MTRQQKTSSPEVIRDLRKKIAYLERKNSRLLDQQVRQEKINDINRQILNKRFVELEHALVLAEQANKAKTDFLANISHEIRTPLNIILGICEILTDTELDTFQKSQLHILNRFGIQLLGILNNVLEISRIDSGNIAVYPQTFSIRTLLSEIESMILPAVEEKGLTLAVSDNTIDSGIRIGDTSKIRQILLNILNNAIKFTSQGHVSLAAQESWSEDDRPRVSFTVSDTGIGIPQEKISMIFDRFSQVESPLTKTNSGVGLGLAISKKFVEALDGEIAVTSEKGCGTTFTVDLPLPVSSSSLPATKKISSRSRGTLPQLQILVADDVKENFGLIQYFLRDLPIQVDYAENGLDALDLLSKTPYDLLLLDISMPILDGISMLRALRQNQDQLINTDVPCIAITAHAFEEQKRENLERGFARVLSKPFGKKELIETIHSVVADHNIDVDPTLDNADVMENSQQRQSISDAMKPLLSEALVRLQSDLKDIRHHLSSQDRKKVAEICHAARGLSGMFQLHHFADCIEQVSAGLKLGNTKSLLAVVSHLQNHLQEMQAKNL